MKPTARVLCDECSTHQRLRPDGVIVRHNVDGHRCGGSEEEPVCALCRTHYGTERTVSPSVFLCSDCDRAVARGDSVIPCTAKGCTRGRVEPYKAGEDDRPCPACDGRSVVYVPASAKGARP